ncbi:MAG: Fe-S-containing protein [Candidatus Kapabacteria bacterium]|nr:Fe-S-containing protein [Candidatus Kapabacteria bacterium]
MNNSTNPRSSSRLTALVAIAAFIALNLVISSELFSQTVTQPVAGVTANFKKYIYTEILSKSTKRDIEYVCILSSKGEVKTCLNACDVCYGAHKGYSKSGTTLVCNNCGNKFAIDGLGTQGTGGCNPGYLPHTIVGDSVVFQIADFLPKGELYFLITPYSSAVEDKSIASASNFNLLIQNDNLKISFEDINVHNCSIFNINGEICKTFSENSSELNADICDLSAGSYLIKVEENGKYVSKVFSISR